MLDGFEDDCWPPLELLNSEPNNVDPLLLEPTVATLVSKSLIVLVMNRPVDLHAKPSRRTIEIENVRTNRMLAPKPQSIPLLLP